MKFQCQAIEFSEFGVLLTPVHKELIAQEIGVKILQNSLKEVGSLKGIVAYGTDIGFGVRFKDNTDSQQEALRHFILAQSNSL